MSTSMDMAQPTQPDAPTRALAKVVQNQLGQIIELRIMVETLEDRIRELDALIAAASAKEVTDKKLRPV